jgi:hypothetical protein
MTHIRVTTYVQHRQSEVCLVDLLPGVFSYALVQQMCGEAFIRECVADGTFVPLELGEVD